ncbi:hypothetical protein Ahy_A10g048650 [Arachis hypogaea]|uniref:Uncharacterized protein n=1 Tax=Arachis hypogaea TaxID=3818 RepID=A0A445B5K3_ARAHY|nr:hypothetical protein Ahy_A10g048650 [Arachis hypogaea]
MKNYDVAHKLAIPSLPKDLIIYILCKTDPATVCRCKLLSHDWRKTLSAFEFVSKYYQLFSKAHPSILIHGKNCFIRLDPKRGNRLFFPLLAELGDADKLMVIGIENGNICLSYNMLQHEAKIIVWNAFTGSKRQILPPKFLGFKVFFPAFAFAYFPKSMHYCILHTFKRNLQEDFIFYSVYSFEDQQWTKISASEGMRGKVGPDYVAENGQIFLIHFTGEDYQFADSILIYSIIKKTFYILPIRDRYRSKCQFLLRYQGFFSFLSHPKDENNYTICIWSIINTKDECFKWKSTLKLKGLSTYDNPKLFVDNDLISLVDDTKQTGIDLKEIVLSRFHIANQLRGIMFTVFSGLKLLK